MKSRIAMVLAALMLMAVVPAGAAEKKPAATKAGTEKKAADDVRARALEEGWPDTPAGRMAFEWVEAFSSGEKAMQAFLESHMSKESLAKKPMSERLATYRSARERIGSLTLADIEESNPTELTAALLAEDATRHRFVFKVQPEAPYYMVSVSTFDTRHGGHGGHGH